MTISVVNGHERMAGIGDMSALGRGQNTGKGVQWLSFS
jgi:hypothetical protein